MAANWVESLLDKTIGQLKFWEIVGEWEQGLYFRKGTAIPPPGKRGKDGSKILKPGMYLYWPIIDAVTSESAQVKPLDAAVIRVMALDYQETDTTAKDKLVGVIVSCTIIIQIKNYYKAYTAVTDYEESIKTFILAVLAKLSRGRKLDFWADRKKVDKLEEEVMTEVKDTVTRDWGVNVKEIYITDSIEGDARSLFLESKKGSMDLSAILGEEAK